jgi:hypothetical protein
VFVVSVTFQDSTPVVVSDPLAVAVQIDVLGTVAVGSVAHVVLEETLHDTVASHGTPEEEEQLLCASDDAAPCTKNASPVGHVVLYSITHPVESVVVVPVLLRP